MMTWVRTTKYAPLIPLRCEQNPDYTIRGAWELFNDGVYRVVYRGYFKRFPIHEIESSTKLAFVQYAVEDFAEEAAYSGNGLLVH